MAAGRADGRDTPLGAKASRGRIRVRGPFGGTHPGQRPAAATKAEHVTALVPDARSGRSPCPAGAVHTCTTVTLREKLVKVGLYAGSVRGLRQLGEDGEELSSL